MKSPMLGRNIRDGIDFKQQTLTHSGPQKRRWQCC